LDKVRTPNLNICSISSLYIGCVLSVFGAEPPLTEHLSKSVSNNRVLEDGIFYRPDENENGILIAPPSNNKPIIIKWGMVLSASKE
jgi:hypothetical protein